MDFIAELISALLSINQLYTAINLQLHFGTLHSKSQSLKLWFA